MAVILATEFRVLAGRFVEAGSSGNVPCRNGDKAIDYGEEAMLDAFAHH